MPQTLDEFVRGTPWEPELARLRAVRAAAAVVLETIDDVEAATKSGAWLPLVLRPGVERLRKAVR